MCFCNTYTLAIRATTHHHAQLACLITLSPGGASFMRRFLITLCYTTFNLHRMHAAALHTRQAVPAFSAHSLGTTHRLTATWQLAACGVRSEALVVGRHAALDAALILPRVHCLAGRACLSSLPPQSTGQCCWHGWDRARAGCLRLPLRHIMYCVHLQPRRGRHQLQLRSAPTRAAASTTYCYNGMHCAVGACVLSAHACCRRMHSRLHGMRRLRGFSLTV